MPPRKAARKEAPKKRAATEDDERRLDESDGDASESGREDSESERGAQEDGDYCSACKTCSKFNTENYLHHADRVYLMGNGPSMLKSRSNKPRVVLESPQGSGTDTRPRVTFAKQRTGTESFKARPQMADVGTIHADMFHGGRVRFQRSQSNKTGSNVDITNSKTSMRSNASGPVSGNWEPTLDPYDRTENGGDISRLIINRDTNSNANSFNRYVGFVERDYRYGNEIGNGLARVDEI